MGKSIFGRGLGLWDIGLDKLSIGKAELAEAASKSKEQKSPRLDSNSISRGKNIKIAEKYLNEAVDGLRKAGVQDHLPRGLLGGRGITGRQEIMKKRGRTLRR